MVVRQLGCTVQCSMWGAESIARRQCERKTVKTMAILYSTTNDNKIYLRMKNEARNFITLICACEISMCTMENSRVYIRNGKLAECRLYFSCFVYARLILC